MFNEQSILFMHNIVITEDLLHEIAEELTENQRIVLYCMSDGEAIPPMSYVASDAHLNVQTVHKIMKLFKSNGIAVYGHLISEDSNHVVGSGYSRSELGNKLHRYMEQNRYYSFF